MRRCYLRYRVCCASPNGSKLWRSRYSMTWDQATRWVDASRNAEANGLVYWKEWKGGPIITASSVAAREMEKAIR